MHACFNDNPKQINAIKFKCTRQYVSCFSVKSSGYEMSVHVEFTLTLQGWVAAKDGVRCYS